MKRSEIEELMTLALSEEITPEQQKKLAAAMKKNAALRKEFDELRTVKEHLEQYSSELDIENDLSQARNALRKRITQERKKMTWFSNLLTWELIPRFQLQYAVVMLVVFSAGFSTSRFVCSPVQFSAETPDFVNIANRDTPQNMKITNVQFVDSDASDGDVEFRFDVTSPMHMKGKINDPEIQKVLTYALLNENNPGTRISSVSAIADQTEMGITVDENIRSALIESMKRDENPGVRREALRVLTQLPLSKEIRDALIYVLSHDGNTGMRVAAINALSQIQGSSSVIDTTIVEVLKSNIQRENNSYVRTKTEHLIREIYQ